MFCPQTYLSMNLCDIFMKIEVVVKICVTGTIALIQYILTYPKCRTIENCAKM